MRTIRDAWLDHGLRARPSDRSVAESAAAELYRLSGFTEPEFIWVPSPPAAHRVVAERAISTPAATDHSPSTRIAGLLASSRERMDKRIAWRRSELQSNPWILDNSRLQSPEESIADGIPPDRIIRSAVWDSLRTTLYDGVATAIRTLLTPAAGGLTWYGQQEAHRVGYYDAIARVGLAQFDSRDEHLLDVQAALIGSTGWWWAFDGVCVMAERPVALHTEPTPSGVHNERRLHHRDCPAIEFSDGKAIYVHHGTVVPDWVVLDPTAERIAHERNVEVRRCAIERIGWDAYIDSAGLDLVDRADDPGNPGCTLELYDTPRSWGRAGRILLVVNGSVERDGHRRRYGLPVPAWAPSALDAAGWTYGISGTDYSTLARRT